MSIRIGEALVGQGVLTQREVEQILARQQDVRRPFGELAEQMFGVDAKAVELAWAEQYATITEHVDPRVEPVDKDIIGLISRRQAWQFRLIPLRRDGHEVMVVTVLEHLPRAMRFALQHFSEPCYFVLTKAEALGEALMKHFPMSGMTADDVHLRSDLALD
jgi:hypothetical protein